MTLAPPGIISNAVPVELRRLKGRKKQAFSAASYCVFLALPLSDREALVRERVGSTSHADILVKMFVPRAPAYPTGHALSKQKRIFGLRCGCRRAIPRNPPLSPARRASEYDVLPIVQKSHFS